MSDRINSGIGINIALFLIGAISMLIVVILIVSISPEIMATGSNFSSNTVETPANSTRDRPSPLDYVQENEIKVYKDRIVIDIADAKWASFEDTKSMLPFINKDSHGLQIEPKCPEEIEVGDIVSYKSEYADGIIIHRVVYKSSDEQGPYFVLKGDNNPSNDPGKIRCSQVQRRLIGIIY